MREAMDIAMGRLLDSLKEIGVDDETLVIFTSDNGGFAGVSDCRPLRESKGHLYEGGIRVPMIVRWPGQVNPGVVCHEPVVSMDFYPTFLDVAGLKPTGKPLDGESLVSLFKQTGKFKKRDLYFHFPNYAWHMDNRLGGAVRSAPRPPGRLRRFYSPFGALLTCRSSVRGSSRRRRILGRRQRQSAHELSTAVGRR